jgi:hypothetical protein
VRVSILNRRDHAIVRLADRIAEKHRIEHEVPDEGQKLIDQANRAVVCAWAQRGQPLLVPATPAWAGLSG